MLNATAGRMQQNANSVWVDNVAASMICC